MRLVNLLILMFLLNSVQAQKKSLDFYLEKANAFSPLINLAKNENKIAGLDLELIKTILSKPEINLEAGVLLAPIISHDNNRYRFEPVSNGATNYTGYDMALTDGGQYQSVISLKQPLFTGSISKSYANRAAIARRISDNRISLTTHELEKVVSHQYLLCLKAKKTADLSLELLKELKDQLLVMQSLVDNAIYKQSDLMLMQIEFENYQLNYVTSRSDFENNLYDLNILCGINDTTSVDLQELDFQLNNNIAVPSAFLGSYLLDSLTINAEQTISDLKYKPQVNFFANAGLNAVYLPTINRLGFSTGLMFSWNIFDGSQQKIQRQKSNINLLTLNFEKYNFLTQQEINKNNILSQLASIEKRIQLTDNQLNKYDELVKVYHVQLSQGQISVIDFKNIVKDIATKKQDRLMLYMEKQALIISFNFWNY
ncbi:MAG: TolC family protein [Porphyromonadaceae bacterium]|nr:MAG: TolC family protein [Porphyromonadaceae bacterium]